MFSLEWALVYVNGAHGARSMNVWDTSHFLIINGQNIYENTCADIGSYLKDFHLPGYTSVNRSIKTYLRSDSYSYL